MSRPDFTSAKALIDPANSLSILLPANPSYDTVAAGLSLKLALEENGKRVVVICKDPMTVEFNRLVGVDTVTNQLATNNNLVISFHDQSELVDTVSYDLDKGELKLVINAKPNATQTIDHRKLKFFPASPKTDLSITVGFAQIDDLKDAMPSTKVLAISHHAPKTPFATHHVSHSEASSLSELVTVMIDTLGFQLHEDIATNLYQGLVKATNNFQLSEVTQTTFEVAALLLRRGARREQVISATDFPKGSIPQSPTGYGTDFKSEEDLVEEVETAVEPAKPADWYEPKIYRGPMLQ